MNFDFNWKKYRVEIDADILNQINSIRQYNWNLPDITNEVRSEVMNQVTLWFQRIQSAVYNLSCVEPSSNSIYQISDNVGFISYRHIVDGQNKMYIRIYGIKLNLKWSLNKVYYVLNVGEKHPKVDLSKYRIASEQKNWEVVPNSFFSNGIEVAKVKNGYVLLRNNQKIYREIFRVIYPPHCGVCLFCYYSKYGWMYNYFKPDGSLLLKRPVKFGANFNEQTQTATYKDNRFGTLYTIDLKGNVSSMQLDESKQISKRRIRLTESQLNNVIKRCINDVLRLRSCFEFLQNNFEDAKKI